MAAKALGDGQERCRFRLAAEKYKLLVSNPERIFLLIPSAARDPYRH